MSLSFNEFQRELAKRVQDPQLQYILTLMYERMSENARQLDECASLLVTFANALETMTKMHQSDQGTIGELARRAGLITKPSGIDVASVAADPDDQ